jgi:hypothetical protein
MSDTTSSVIDTGALLLRHLTLDDTATMFRLSQEQGMRIWIPNQVYADEAQALEVLRFLSSQYGRSANPRHTPYVLGVCLSASHELIGHVGFSPCDYGVEVGYAHRRRSPKSRLRQAGSIRRYHMGALQVRPSIHLRCSCCRKCPVMQGPGIMRLPVAGRDSTPVAWCRASGENL